ncbi:Uncharacterised protein [Chlamydia trachomatis]|nr:Uncharacterised protein [Chlamydia trachomatis]
MTLIVCWEPFAIVDRREDFPPPGSEKMPTRCPSPMVRRASIARIPVGNTSWIGVRDIGEEGEENRGERFVLGS